jgi:protein TonB
MTTRFQSFAIDELGATRLSRGQMAAVGFSLAIHMAIGGYLAYQKFNPPLTEATPLPPVITVENWTPPDPPKPAPAAPASAVRIHRPVSIPIGPVEALPTRIIPGDEDLSEGPPTSVTFSGQEGGAGEATDAVRAAPVISRPDWIRKPGAREFERHFPDAALRKGIAGAATLDCRVAANGTVNSCRVVDESPAGENFGSAAIKLSKYFVMRPRTEDGRPVDGAAVRIPLRFEVAD